MSRAKISEGSRPIVSITLDIGTLHEVAKRGDNRSGVIDKLIARMCGAMNQECLKLAKVFGKNECACLLDALTPSPMWCGEAEVLAMFVEQQCLMKGLPAKYKVDGKNLVTKLWALDLLGKLALIDAVERWHYRAACGEKPGLNPFMEG